MAFLSTNEPDHAVPGIFDRFLKRANGIAFMMASVGLWFVPMLERLPEIHLMKLGVSCFLALAGFGFVLASRKRRRR